MPERRVPGGHERAPGAGWLVAAALELEGRALRRRRRPAAEEDLAVVIVGPGAVRLGALDAALAGSRPRGVLAAGLAGGCGPGVEPGEIVIGAPVAHPGPAPQWRHPDRALLARALDAVGAAGLPYRVGRLLTVDQVAATPAAKAAWWAAHRALAVDMESARILAWAERAGLPGLAVRAVADGPRESLPPELLAALGEAGRVRVGGVAALVARRPVLAGAAWRLGRRSRLALARLGRFLRAFITLPVRP